MYTMMKFVIIGKQFLQKLLIELIIAQQLTHLIIKEWKNTLEKQENTFTICVLLVKLCIQNFHVSLQS